MSKCKICKKQAMIKTVDGNFCREHLPAGFCPRCGQVAANNWYKLSIQELGMCWDCVNRKLNHMSEVYVETYAENASTRLSDTFDDEIAFVLDDLEPIYNPVTMEMAELPAAGEVTPDVGTAIRRIQEQLGFTDDEEEEY